jgi:hypothetical protein
VKSQAGRTRRPLVSHESPIPKKMNGDSTCRAAAKKVPQTDRSRFDESVKLDRVSDPTRTCSEPDKARGSIAPALETGIPVKRLSSWRGRGLVKASRGHRRNQGQERKSGSQRSLDVARRRCASAKSQGLPVRQHRAARVGPASYCFFGRSRATCLGKTWSANVRSGDDCRRRGGHSFGRLRVDGRGRQRLGDVPDATRELAVAQRD